MQKILFEQHSLVAVIGLESEFFILLPENFEISDCKKSANSSNADFQCKSRNEDFFSTLSKFFNCNLYELQESLLRRIKAYLFNENHFDPLITDYFQRIRFCPCYNIISFVNFIHYYPLDDILLKKERGIGQIEIIMPPTHDLLGVVALHDILLLILEELILQYGLKADFSPCPKLDDYGSALQVNISLHDFAIFGGKIKKIVNDISKYCTIYGDISCNIDNKKVFSLLWPFEENNILSGNIAACDSVAIKNSKPDKLAIWMELYGATNVFSHHSIVDNTVLQHSIGGLLRDIENVVHHLIDLYPEQKKRFLASRGVKFMSPSSTNWGVNNRYTAVRIPGCSDLQRRIEYRLGGAGVPIDFLVTASLQGVIHGLEQNISPPPPCYIIPKEEFWFPCDES